MLEFLKNCNETIILTLRVIFQSLETGEHKQEQDGRIFWKLNRRIKNRQRKWEKKTKAAIYNVCFSEH